MFSKRVYLSKINALYHTLRPRFIIIGPVIYYMCV
jgi:hypothetical protein